MYVPNRESWTPYTLRDGGHITSGDDVDVDPDTLFPAHRAPIRPNLNGWVFHGVIFKGVDFVGAQFRDTTFEDCRFERCTLRASDFQVSMFSRTAFANCSFSSVRFTYCSFSEHNIIDQSSLTNVKIANVADCHLNISNSNLTNVKLRALQMFGSIYGCTAVDCYIDFCTIREKQLEEYTNFRFGKDIKIEGEHSWVPNLFDALPNVRANDLWKLLKEAPKDPIERLNWMTELVLVKGEQL